VSKSIQKSSQQQWLEILVGQAGHEPYNTIWRNILNPDSLRLNDHGYNWAVKNCGQTGYRIKVDKPITNQVLLQLDRLMTAPYHVHGRTQIALLGEQDAMMLQLHAGDLEQYLNNLSAT
jgi:hypothetical protein